MSATTTAPSVSTEERIRTVSPAAAARRRERIFYITMGAVIVLTIVAGFSRTYFLRPLFTSEPLMPLLHLHGAIFTSWLVLYLTQTLLISAKRVDVHRRLGMLGGLIAVSMVVVGAATAIIRAQQGATPPGGPPPLVFLVVPLGDLVVFSTLIGAGLYFRRRPAVHKRLMLLATISVMAAGVARLPGIMALGPLAFFGITDIFVLACAGYDLVANRRIHRATLLGGLLLILSHPLRLIIGGTGVWLAFATWLTHFVG